MCDYCNPINETPEEIADREAHELECAERAAEKVQEGVRMLDVLVEAGELESGWADRIDLANFSITSIRDCILGQLFKSDQVNEWGDTEPGFGQGETALYNNGKMSPYEGGFTTSEGDWNLLQEAWTQAVRKLQTV